MQTALAPPFGIWMDGWLDAFVDLVSGLDALTFAPDCISKGYQFMISFSMHSKESKETGLDYLLGLDGNIEFQNDEGYWVKMDVSRVAVTAERPLGIKYSLTLHTPDGARLMGFDNAHGGIKLPGHAFCMPASSIPTITGIATPQTVE
jgi:hypothetical protein